MPKYLTERSIPGVGGLSAGDLQGISQKPCNVLRQLGPDVQWVQSYVTGDKIYCVYNATREQQLRGQVRRGGFPIDRVASFMSTTAETSSASA